MGEYAGANSGFAIGVRSSILSSIAVTDKGRLGHCIYDPSDQISILNEMIDLSLSNIAKYSKISDQILFRESSIFQKSLMKYGAFFKDFNFREEGEWRLCTPVASYTGKNFDFRPGKSMLVPYQKIPLLQHNSWKDVVETVIIGPCPHPEVSKLAVEGLLMKYGCIKDTQLGGYAPAVSSSIPYRNW